MTSHFLVAGVLLFFSGAAWVGVLVNFNVAVQISVPDWVRGRALAFYLLAFQGSLALDGALWGLACRNYRHFAMLRCSGRGPYCRPRSYPLFPTRP